MNFKSLSAKIVAAVFLLVALAFVADLLIAQKINRSVNAGSRQLVAEMEAALLRKDDLLAELLAERLRLDEERQGLAHHVAESEEKMKTDREANLLRGMHFGISTSAVTLVAQAMMTGEALAAQEIMETLVENPSIAVINLWRVDGTLPFHDNATLDEVNKLLGGEAFPRRKEQPPVHIEGARAAALAKAVETLDSDVTLDELVEVDGEEVPVTFAYQVLENAPECQGCHGESEKPRGVVEVALSRAELMRLTRESQDRLADLDAKQAAELEQLKARNASAASGLKTESAKLANLMETSRKELEELQSEAGLWNVLSKLAFFVIAIVVLVLVLRRLLTSPLTGMAATMHRLAGGDLAVEIPAKGRGDEIGEMAAAVEVFRDNGVRLRTMTAQSEAQHRRDQRKLQSEMMALTNALDEEVKAAIGIVMQQSDAMSDAAREMSQAVTQTEAMATAAAGASGNASGSVEAVAAAAEELAISVREISAQVEKSTDITSRAVLEAESTNRRIQGLAEAAQKIGEVVSLITDIAEQTNLLALNATIEAARAGEAGKGFAVVASEVKNLANQTGKATEEISSQIGDIQAATRQAVDAIQGIGNVIGEISNISNSIASAIERQSEATNNISENARQAAHSTHEASSNIGEVSRNASETGGHSREVELSAGEVRERVQQMQMALDSIMHTHTDDAERERNQRYTVNVAVVAELGGRSQPCLLLELAVNGAAVLDRPFDGDRGDIMQVEVPTLGRMESVLVAVTENSTHIRFDLSDQQAEALEKFIAAKSKAKS